MKVAVVLGPFYALPPSGCGAVERVWHELSQAFCDAGHDVMLIGKAGNVAPGLSRTGNRTTMRLSGYTATGNIGLDLLKDFAYGLQVRRLLRDADVVIANSFWLPVVLRLRPRRAGALIVHVARYPKHQMRLYGNANVVQAISGAVAGEIVRQCPALRDKVKVLPYHVHLDVFSPPLDGRNYSGSLTVLYAGRVHPEKGVHLLIEALGSLVHAGRPVMLRVVGPTSIALGGGGAPYMSRLRDLAHGLPVEFVEPITDPSALAAEYRNAHCFCYPSLAERGEAFGLAALEAMATGLPVVVSDLACFRDFIEDGVDGAVFDHRESAPVEALARGLDRILTDAGLAARLGTQAHLKAQQYGYEAVATRYVALAEAVYSESVRTRRAAVRPGLPHA